MEVGFIFWEHQMSHIKKLLKELFWVEKDFLVCLCSWIVNM